MRKAKLRPCQRRPLIGFQNIPKWTEDEFEAAREKARQSIRRERIARENMAGGYYLACACGFQENRYMTAKEALTLDACERCGQPGLSVALVR